jgi:predicted helicase
LKWTDRLKEALVRRDTIAFDQSKVRDALYRPFSRQYIYFDHLLNQRRYQQHHFFPTPTSELENVTICLTAIGSDKPFMVLPTTVIPDLHLTGAGTGAQCFPYYVYDEDGTNRRENITDWALKQFQEAHGEGVAKWDIFHYVYALLHDPPYRERYAENLKRELPRVPASPVFPGTPVPEGETETMLFRRFVEIGAELLRLHRDYEQAPEYPLTWLENRDVPFTWRVEKMRLSKDRTQIVVNPSLTLGGIPAEAFSYRLGNRSALDWVIDQYQVSTDKRSGIASDPNREDDPEYIVRLVGRVVTVSVETVRLVQSLRMF